MRVKKILERTTARGHTFEENLRKNNSKRAYQMVEDLTTVKQGKATTVQDRSGKMPHRRATDTEPMNRILL